MKELLVLLIMISKSPGVTCQNKWTKFVDDIIAEWKLLNPTLVVGGEEVWAVDFCFNKTWVLCLINDHEQKISQVADHLGTVHSKSKQDGLVFVGTSNYMLQLIESLAAQQPMMFRSGRPTFMPTDYASAIR